VTGAHLYGFPSADSDVDLKAIHLAPTPRVLGLGPVMATHDVLIDFEGLEHDFTSHEAGKALALLLRGNGNMLERILSPMQLVCSPEVEALQALARGAVSRRFHAHYRGFFGGVRREDAQSPTPVAKKLLYAYRVALTGIHLMRTGALEANLSALAAEYRLPEVLELIERKARGAEKGAIDPNEASAHRARLDELGARLERCHETSPLPEEAPNSDALDAWLVETRLAPGRPRA
jgi:predicted nucleotidyltransferase